MVSVALGQLAVRDGSGNALSATASLACCAVAHASFGFILERIRPFHFHLHLHHLQRRSCYIYALMINQSNDN
jgi:hypothetical protein